LTGSAVAPATATCAAGRSSSSSPKTKISSSSPPPSGAILTTRAPAAASDPSASPPASAAGRPGSGPSAPSAASGPSTSAPAVIDRQVIDCQVIDCQVIDCQVIDCGDIRDVGLAQVRIGQHRLQVHVIGVVEIVELHQIRGFRIPVGIEICPIQICAVEIHRDQAGIRVGAHLGTLVRVLGSRTGLPRSRVHRLILDGPGLGVRSPGALPRCGIGSAHDHGHPFLR
jgi:hypothetical protein